MESPRGDSRTNERVGRKFEHSRLRIAREKTWLALHKIAESIQPGILESEATELGQKILADMGAMKFWHPVHIRFGEHTLLGPQETSKKDLRLQKKDIFFVDIGPVFDDHEGDAGKTFVRGGEARLIALSEKPEQIFLKVKRDWETEQLPGVELYERALSYAKELQVELLTSVKGHRISDFPHNLITKDRLFDLPHPPKALRWVLEIQIQDQKLKRGAFFEDFL